MKESGGKYRIMGIDPGTNYMGYGILEVEGNALRSVVMGDIDLHTMSDPYRKLHYIFKRVGKLIEDYDPQEVALESPFFGTNVQSMLKLGRAQGVAIAAAISRDVPIHEYAPLKIKLAITGSGSSSKEQVADMLRRMLKIDEKEMPRFMDATDALGAAYCHFMQQGRPVVKAGYSSWKDFIAKNPDKVKE